MYTGSRTRSPPYPRGVDYLKEDSCNAPGDHDTAFKQCGKTIRTVTRRALLA